MINFVRRPLVFRVLLKSAKRLSLGILRTGGRNSFGRLVSFNIGGGKNRRVLKFIDFWRRLVGYLRILKITRDSFHSVTLTLVFFEIGYLTYLVLPDIYQIGEMLFFDYNKDNSYNLKNLLLRNSKVNSWGNAKPLSNLKIGTLIFNIELWPLKGAQICRSAGTSALLVGSKKNKSFVKLASGWTIIILSSCFATIGVSPSGNYIFKSKKKAGKNRNLGIRPSVRGVAMNSVDHPHGGGRGKSSKNVLAVSPWGLNSKGLATISKKKRFNSLYKCFKSF